MWYFKGIFSGLLQILLDPRLKKLAAFLGTKKLHLN